MELLRSLDKLNEIATTGYFRGTKFIHVEPAQPKLRIAASQESAFVRLDIYFGDGSDEDSIFGLAADYDVWTVMNQITPAGSIKKPPPPPQIYAGTPAALAERRAKPGWEFTLFGTRSCLTTAPTPTPAAAAAASPSRLPPILRRVLARSHQRRMQACVCARVRAQVKVNHAKKVIATGPGLVNATAGKQTEFLIRWARTPHGVALVRTSPRRRGFARACSRSVCAEHTAGGA